MGVGTETTALRISQDAWLSEMMERPVFRVDVDTKVLTPAACASLAAHAAGRRSAMYFAKVDAAAVAAVRDLSRAGMHVVDVSVALDLDANASRPDTRATAVVVDDCRPEDAEQVLDIAGSCFRFSRFHVDPDVPLAMAHRIKREWIANYVRGLRGDRLLVARVNGRVVGFLAVMSVPEGERRVRVIDLVGVRADDQQRGVGMALVAAFLDSSERADGKRVITQAANIRSLRLYQRFGFRVTRTGYVLHMHV
jgi:ribosomal protein S18 acetylase RimI-like enzyme